MNMEQEFEDSSIDYCITFEVSPPAFEAPNNMVTEVAPEIHDALEAVEHFMLPEEIAEHSDALMEQIENYIAWHNPTVLNCSRLIRVEFNAASQLMNHLEPLVRRGAVIRMQAVNHLVAALFRVAGMHEIVHIETRKI
jgi:anti-anti-sigma regulatory factor